jgi:hypothetical protein
MTHAKFYKENLREYSLLEYISSHGRVLELKVESAYSIHLGSMIKYFILFAEENPKN